MKKKIFAIIGIAAIAVTAAFNVNITSSRNVTSLTLSNIEALAQEGSGSTNYEIYDRTRTLTTESYTTTEPGWQWSVKANIWFLNGERTWSKPPSYQKVTVTTTDQFKCCQSGGKSLCTHIPCDEAQVFVK